MSKAKLEARVEALEKVATPDSEPPLLMICLVGMGEEAREMNRAEIGRKTYDREPIESEAEFKERIACEVRKTKDEGKFTLAFLRAI